MNDAEANVDVHIGEGRRDAAGTGTYCHRVRCVRLQPGACGGTGHSCPLAETRLAALTSA
jgi:hypothetical protein